MANNREITLGSFAQVREQFFAQGFLQMQEVAEYFDVLLELGFALVLLLGLVALGLDEGDEVDYFEEELLESLHALH